MNDGAFQPASGAVTQLVAATTAPSVAIQNLVGAEGIRLRSDAAVWFAFGSSIGSSGLSATLPTTSTPGNAIPLDANQAKAFRTGPKAFLSFVTTSGTANVAATPGGGAS